MIPGVTASRQRMMNAAYDPYWDKVVALLKMDGVSGSGSFVDSGPLGVSVGRTGEVRHSEAWAVSGQSAEFYSGGGYLALGSPSSFTFGTDDFTIEGFMRINDASAAHPIFDARGTYKNGNYVAFGFDTGGLINLYVGGAAKIAAPHGLASNEAAHVALSRASGKTRIFVKGMQVGGTFGDSTNYGLGAARPVIGALGFDVGLGRFLGFMDEFRVTRGVGRYAKNFTPPTGPFPTVGGAAPAPEPDPPSSDPYWANVVALIKPAGADGSTTFTDLSASGKAITRVGDTKVSTVQSKFGDGSAAFDGNGDKLTLAASSDFAFGSGDFTIEAWFCLTGGKDYARLVHFGPFWASNDALGINVKDADYPGKVTFSSYKLGGRPCVSSSNVTLNVWHHVAVTRASGVFRLFFNGVLESTNSSHVGVSVDSSSANTLAIGSATTTSGGEDMAGLADNVRVTKGVARYITSFTPPTTPFPTTGP